MSKKQTLHIYTRVSTQQQVDDGTSLSNQRQQGIEMSEKLKMNYKVWNEGGKSSWGEVFEREVLSDMLVSIKSGDIKHLYVYDIDRLSRNKYSWNYILREIEENEVVVYTSMGQYDLSNERDDIMMGFMTLVSTMENKVRVKRSRQGKINKFLEGYYVHGTDIFGYDRVRKGKGIKLVENKEQSKVLQKIFTLFSKGKSVLEIKRYLLKNKIKTSRGKDVFSDKQILDMLRRQTYHGLITWTDTKTKKTYNGTCKKLIEDDIWYEVQKRLQTIFEKSRQKNRQKHDYLLTGNLFCGCCGYLMRGLTHKKTYRHLYYCGTKEERYRNGKLKQIGCDRERSKSVNVGRLDDLVWNTLIDTIENSDILKEQIKTQVLGEGKKNRDSVIKKLVRDKNKELRDFRKTLSKQELKEEDLYRLWIEDTIDEEQRDKFMKEVLKIKLDIQSDIQRLENDKQRLLQSSRWIDWVSVFVNDIDKLKDITDLKERKEVIEQYVKRIECSYDVGTKHHHVEIDLRLRLFNDKYVVVGSDNKGHRKYDVIEGDSSKVLKLGETKSGRKSKKKMID